MDKFAWCTEPNCGQMAGFPGSKAKYCPRHRKQRQGQQSAERTSDDLHPVPHSAPTGHQRPAETA